MLFSKLIEFMHLSILMHLTSHHACVSLGPKLHPTELSLAYYCVQQLVFNDIHEIILESL